MNKAELIGMAAANADLTQKDMARALDCLIETIMGAVASGQKVTLVGFGTFEAMKTAARTGRNPTTGEALDIPAKVRPKFKAGKEFKNQVGGSL